MSIEMSKIVGGVVVLSSEVLEERSHGGLELLEGVGGQEKLEVLNSSIWVKGAV